VRDGVHDTAFVSPIVKYCTDVDDVSVTSLSSELTIEFRSDGRDEGPGFSATYEFIYRSSTAGRWQQQQPLLRRPETSLVGLPTKRPAAGQSGKQIRNQQTALKGSLNHTFYSIAVGSETWPQQANETCLLAYHLAKR
jgi:hypothetical protein